MVFAWSYEDMLGINPKITQHHIDTHAHMVPVKQKWRRMRTEWLLWWKYACVQWKNNESTSFVIDNMCLWILEYENKSVPWCVEFQNKDCKHLGILLIFTPIPLMPKMCGLSISNVNLFKRELERVSNTHIHHFIFIKILYVSLHIFGYLIGLAFWAFPIGL